MHKGMGVPMGLPRLDPYGYRIADTEKEQTPLYTNRAGGNLRKREASAKLRARERISERSRSVVLPPVNEDYGW